MGWMDGCMDGMGWDGMKWNRWMGWGGLTGWDGWMGWIWMSRWME